MSTIQNWIMDALESPMAKDNNLSSWIFFTLWIIWNARNDSVFNNKTPNPLSSLHKVKTQCIEFLSATDKRVKSNNHQQEEQQNSVQVPPTQWRPPRDPYVKINSDSAFEQETGKGFSGIICRDSQGKLLTASTTRFFSTSPLVAEALSLRDAISFAVNLQLDKVIFESDNQTLIEVCRKNLIRRELEGIVADIDSLRSNFQYSGLTWTKREGNSCAHTIASVAQKNQLQRSWVLSPPSILRRALVKDAQALWR